MSALDRSTKEQLGNRDTEMRIEVKNATNAETLAALEQFLESQKWDRIGLEKEGDSFSMRATSENEPTCS